MSLPTFAHQTVTVLRAPLVLDHGAQVRNWAGAVQRTPIERCMVVPRVGTTGTVDLVNRYAVSTLFVVYAEIGMDVADTDRIEYSGRAYAIDGAVQRFEAGVLDHLEIPLKRVEG